MYHKMANTEVNDIVKKVCCPEGSQDHNEMCENRDQCAYCAC